jgi:hypothetical protein
MTWNGQDDLDRVRREGQRRDGTLFGAVLPLKDETLTNEELLGRLATAKTISEVEAERILDVIKAYAKVFTDVDLKGYNRALFYSSLPETYVYGDIAALLVRTGQLAKSATVGPRVDNTGKVTVKVLQGMADTKGAGMLIALGDLGMRHSRLATAHNRSGDYPYINQVGLAYTLLTFSYTPFLAMRRAGRDVPEESVRQSWLAMWNVVGSLMGIEEGGLPASLDDAGRLLGLIRESPGYGKTPDGIQLMTTLRGIAREPKFAKYTDSDVLALLTA